MLQPPARARAQFSTLHICCRPRDCDCRSFESCNGRTGAWVVGLLLLCLSVLQVFLRALIISLPRLCLRATFIAAIYLPFPPERSPSHALPHPCSHPHIAARYQPGDKEFIKQSVLQHLTVGASAFHPTVFFGQIISPASCNSILLQSQHTIPAHPPHPPPLSTMRLHAAPNNHLFLFSFRNKPSSDAAPRARHRLLAPPLKFRKYSDIYTVAPLQQLSPLLLLTRTLVL